MTGLTLTQHSIVAAVFSLTGGMLGAVAVFLIAQRAHVQKRHMLPLTVLTVMALLAAYSYMRLYGSWMDGFAAAGAAMRPTSTPFNDWYRYTHWLVTVPLLLTAIPYSLEASRKQARGRAVVLALLGFEMIALGFPGIWASTTDSRLLWLGASSVPMLLIIMQLFGTVGAAIRAEPQPAQGWMRSARTILVVSWLAYPIIYSMPLLSLAGINLSGSTVFMWTQVAYTVADLMSKAVFSLFICAALTSKQDMPEAATRAGPPPRAKAPMSMAETAGAAD